MVICADFEERDYSLTVCLVKVKVKVNFILEQATKPLRGIRGIALLFLNLGARWGWVVGATPRPLYPR